MSWIRRLSILCLLISSAGCPSSRAEDKMLNGSASQVQSMSSAVKLTKPTEVVMPRIRTLPAAPVNSNLHITSVDPNAIVPIFNRVRALGPDGQPAPVRAPAPTASLTAATQRTMQGSADGSSGQTNGSQNGVTNVSPEFQTFSKAAVKQTGQQAAAQTANWQMKSKAKLLTQPLQNQTRSANWNDWYKRVAKTVYDQWTVNQTGPGKVCIQVTVWSTRSIEGRVMRFENAPDSVRTSAQQVVFSNAALQAVNSLDNNGILEFPINEKRNKVIFELDISRLVGGASGCQVVNAH